MPTGVLHSLHFKRRTIMINPRWLACLSMLAIAGCGAVPGQDQSNSTKPGDATASFSPAEQRLLDGGASQVDVLSARAFAAPFTRTDDAACYRAADLGGAKMAVGDTVGDAPQLVRVAIAVDGSGSMAGRMGSQTKLERAKEATRVFIDNLPAGVPVSLSVFGQQGNNSESGKAKSCKSVDVLAAMSADRASLKSAVEQVRAVGWTPLAAGLRAAQGQLAASSVPGEQIVYVVSDGIETCGGDPAAVARDINLGGTRAIVNIIGFGLPTGEAAALQSVASAGGGRFVNVSDDNGFERAMASFREQMRLAQNRVAAGLAGARNTIATGASATEAVQCTGRIIDRETQAALSSYDARAKLGEALPPRYQIVALLQERRDALSARRDGFTKRLGSSRDAANKAVEAQRDAAQ
jgi:Ca-activated chloride channel family protein